MLFFACGICTGKLSFPGKACYNKQEIIFKSCFWKWCAVLRKTAYRSSAWKQTQKQIVLGILAHVDSGKTTLSEAMLYRAGAIRKLGRVDHGDAFLDTDSLEKARGITIFSKQALLTAGNTAITLLDTPGHVDFSTETERTLQVLDYAVLVVSGTDGVQTTPKRCGGCCGATMCPPLCS